jgi:hypothetical protein
MERDFFDLSLLPFQVTDDVAIESVASMLKESLEVFSKRSEEKLDRQRSIEYALVHRYETEVTYRGTEDDAASIQLLHNLAACLRIVRPMRQPAGLMQGHFKQDGTFDVMHMEYQYEFDVPANQKLFALRTRDAYRLRALAPHFLKAMSPPIGKFQMAMQFHDAGHFAFGFWKAKYLVWCSALEALFTSQHPQHKGGLVAKSRIKWFLGDATTIYPQGELGEFDDASDKTVGGIIDDVYRLRNMLAHGDQVPDEDMVCFFRKGLGGTVNLIEGMFEGLSFIIRSSLLKILEENLLSHFANGGTANAYFAAEKLTLNDLRARPRSRAGHGQ